MLAQKCSYKSCPSTNTNARLWLEVTIFKSIVNAFRVQFKDEKNKYQNNIFMQEHSPGRLIRRRPCPNRRGPRTETHPLQWPSLLWEAITIILT